MRSNVVPPVARRQGGVFTADQAIDAGFSSRQVRRRREFGQWQVLAGRGLIGRDAGRSPLAWAWAATLTWPRAVISHQTAATLHGLPVPAFDGAHVVIEQGRQDPPRTLIVHQIRLPADEVVGRAGLRMTTLHRTVVDCLGSLPFGDALDLWAWLSTRQLITRQDLAGAAMARTGRRGTPQLLRLLRYTRTGAVSPAEWRLHQLLRRAGIAGWQAGVTVRDVDGVPLVVDLLFAELKVVIEVDGWRAHQGHHRFVADRQRIRRLTAMGYLVLPITWDDLVNRPEELLAQILTVLASRAA
jgi:very-short-patch-repair endonuclease